MRMTEIQKVSSFLDKIVAIFFAISEPETSDANRSLVSINQASLCKFSVFVRENFCVKDSSLSKFIFKNKGKFFADFLSGEGGCCVFHSR